MNAWKSQNLSPDKSCWWPGWNILLGVLIVGFILIPASAIANAEVIDLHSSLELNNNQTLCPTEDPQTIADSFDSGSWVYCTQAGDTLRSVAARFQVHYADVQHSLPVSPYELLDEGLELNIPRSLNNIFHIQPILPDKEVVYSPSAAGFDTFEFVSRAGGYLSDHQEYLRSTGPTSGPEIVERVALENSVNPRLLLALLEYQCGCVYGSLRDGVEPQFLMGVDDPTRNGLYRQLGWVVNQLSLGYYGWRRGLLTDLSFPDLSSIQLAPDLNAGSAGLAYLFSRLYDRQGWEEAIDPETGFEPMHQQMFGDSWLETDDNEPLFPAGLVQPELILPFVPDREWGYTSGPHQAWETEGALAALDFAPASDEYGCHRSNEWAVAVADGLVARSEHGALVLDLDGDGFESTGWAILYMHVEERGRVPSGTSVNRGDPLGHPSCEGGPADGTHLHIARKYNGEWIAADGPLPFTMSGWVAHEGYRPFEGALTRGVQSVVANPLSPAEAFISREADENPPLLKISHDFWWEE